MNIVCIICSELLAPSDDVFYTPCGHIFHFHCLTQWLERSKTCPQCRDKTTSNKIHRLYFNFSNSDTIVEDSCSLQDKIDKLNFQLMLKEKDIKHYAEKSQTLENQNKGLKKEVRKVESELNEKNSNIYALKEQMKYFKVQQMEAENKSKEIEQLHKKLDNYKNIQTLLEASVENVDEMIARSRDPHTLITYISVMKREMTISLNKRRELRTKLKDLQQELTKVSMERNFLSNEHTKRKKLEEDLITCETEKMSLQSKLKELERDMFLLKKSIKCDLNAIEIPNSNSSNTLKLEKKENALYTNKTEKRDADLEEQNEATAATSKSDSPYLPVKSRGIFVLKQHASQKHTTLQRSGSILTKKSRIERSSIRNEQIGSNPIAYDGFGGHSKLDHFPIPSGIKVKTTKDDTTKPKRPRTDTDGNHKYIMTPDENTFIEDFTRYIINMRPRAFRR